MAGLPLTCLFKRGLFCFSELEKTGHRGSEEEPTVPEEHPDERPVTSLLVSMETE